MKLRSALAVASLTLSFAAGTAMADSTSITGAGSTFIYPVLSQWTKTYANNTGVKINYQPIGSGGGIQQLTNKTVDFAASDVPLTLAKQQQNDWTQFPMIIGGIVPTVNIQGITDGQLVLNGAVLADIYLGKVKYWDNAEIKKLNPSLKLPHNMIVTVHRADGSGTTYNFTNYLSKVSPEWQQKVGSNTLVSWPGFGLGAKGNAGVASQVSGTENTIGYVEYAYALQNHMVTAKMVNANGKTVSASAESFAAAAKNARWQANNGFNLILTNQPGAQSWPIVATTFILIPNKGQNTAVSLKFFKWAYANGAAAASKLDYVSIPQSVYQMVEGAW